MFVWWRDVIREAVYRAAIHNPVVQIGLRYRHGAVHRLGGDVLLGLLLGLFQRRALPDRGDRRRLAAQGHPSLRSVRRAVPQHADPAALGHDGDLGASRAAREQPQGPDPRPRPSPWSSASASPRCRPTNTATPPSASPRASIPRPSSWRRASTASMSSSARSSSPSAWSARIKGHFTPDHHFGFEAAAWYWHFVDVVWLFLFICIYWWGSVGAAVGDRVKCR